jgi:predicted nucleotidyltransferase
MDSFRDKASVYTKDLHDNLGSRLRSVVLHGSVARNEAVPGVSDVNLLVLVDSVDGPMLRKLAPLARRWLQKERSLPLVLTWDEWLAARDAFAVETSDMIDAHELLLGDDPLHGAHVANPDLRLQAERELRGKQIHLREGTLAAADRPKDLGRLLLTALPSVATYLRAALRLAGREATGPTPSVLQNGCVLVGADPEPALRLWDLRGRAESPSTAVEDPLVTGIHTILETTASFVDTFSGDRS